MKLIKTSMVAAGLLAAAAFAPANAQDGRVLVGTLMCNGPGQTSFIVGSITQMHCVFTPEVGRPSHYNARITRVGVDIGVTTENALAWAVRAPTRKLGPTELAGKYGGVAAGAA